ncbi:MAG: hypothetical protein AMXMBFR47_16690 [Planctomycetota bacterium]
MLREGTAHACDPVPLLARSGCFSGGGTGGGGGGRLDWRRVKTMPPLSMRDNGGQRKRVMGLDPTTFTLAM